MGAGADDVGPTILTGPIKPPPTTAVIPVLPKHVSTPAPPKPLIATTKQVYYCLWAATIILTAVCVQDFYNEYYPHAQFRDSAMCADPAATQSAGFYAYVYCKRHT